MKDTIAKFSSERLEQEISHAYYRAAKEAPGVSLQESGNLGLLWQEFDERIEVGAISADTDWTPKAEWEDF